MLDGPAPYDSIFPLTDKGIRVEGEERGGLDGQSVTLMVALDEWLR